MKAIVMILSVLFVFTINADAQQKTVDEAVNTLLRQLENPTQAGLEALTLPELSYGHSSGKIENQKEFIEALVSGKSDFITIKTKDVEIKIVGKTATVRHILEADIKDGGVANTVKLKVLLVWVKGKGGWKLLARQAVKLV
ncbi:DUF4440 domain-containing protein [Emticicia sp. CRIBPO]|uniref:nuclear transport factor 2 family protein n=1 Tax=Emticicia sp. CRIBPO TaxID=2683258 RepID=UPI0014122658|nr:nuclear transport factor 2 family protein [Emticicia sp. CRIBPO]NBA88398.1 DUF4440 domain-containing protein [Emticicia sp. CRIBPO]